MSFRLATINLMTTQQPMQIQIPSNLQLNQIGWIEFLNESPFKVFVSSGSVNIVIPAWTDYPLLTSKNNVVQSSLTFPINLTWNLLTNTNNVPTELDIVIYSRGESPSSSTPVALTRQVASTVANASSVTNTGFPPGTTFIYGSPVGDNVGPVQISNNGVMSLGDSTYNGSESITGPDGSTTFLFRNSLSMQNGATVTEFSYDQNGNVFANGTVTTPTGVVANVLTAQASNDIGLHVGTGQKVAVTVNGVDQAHLDATGLNLFGSGGLIFPSPFGSIHQIRTFTATVSTTPTFTNHNLTGVIPDFVVVVANGITGTGIISVDYGSMTTTQVKLTGNATFNVVGLSIKF